VITVGPRTLTVGVGTAINDPAQGNGSKAVQIQNASPYQLTVLALGDVITVPGFFAQTVEMGEQPIVVTPVAASATGAASNITFVFLLGVAAGDGITLPDGTQVETPPVVDGSLTAAAIQAASAPPGLVFGPTVVAVVGNAVTESVPISNVTRALYVDVVTGAPSGLILGIEVQGNQSGLVYRSGPYYLNAPSTNGYLAVVPVSGVLDTSVTVSLANVPAGTATLAVYGDSTETPESVFYNGAIEVASGSTATTEPLLLLTGPARLLSATVMSTPATTEAILAIEGVGAIISYGTPAVAQPFPPNTILPAGKVVQLVAGAATAIGGVTYAYP
jgi:hypothetical protein